MNKKTFPVICFITAFLLLFAGGILSGRDNIYININLRPNFSLEDEINGGVNGRGFSKIDMTLYRVDMEEVIKTITKAVERPKDGFSDILRGETIKEWTMNFEMPERGNWVRNDFNIDNPGTGSYLLEAKTEGKTVRRFFIVTSIAAISKYDDSKLIVFVVDRRTGEPREGAKVGIVNNGEISRGTTTGKNGIARFMNVRQAGSAPVIITWKGQPAALNFYNYSSHGTDEKLYIYTDRPAYRPGQTVHIKGVARNADNYSYSIPSDKTVEVVVTDPRGNEVMRRSTALTEFGTFTIDCELGDEPPLGYYNIRIISSGGNHYSGFKVEEYRKPEYLVTVTPEKDIAVRGDELSFTINTKYYFGEPVTDADIKYKITKRRFFDWYGGGVKYPWYANSRSRRIAPPYYRGGEPVAEGTVKSDEKGSASIKFDKTNVDYQTTFILTATVTDRSRREVTGSGSVKVMTGEFRVFVDTNRYLVKPGEKLWITVNTLDIHDKPVSRALTMKISKITWNKQEKTTKEIMRRTIETSESGRTKTNYIPDEAGYYEIEVFGADSRDNPIKKSAFFSVADRKHYYSYYSRGEVEMIADKDTYKPGDNIQVLITTPFVGASALITIEGKNILHSEVQRLENGMALVDFMADARHQPNVFVAFTTIYNNAVVQQKTNIIVPPEDKFLDVRIESDKEIYEPGDKAEVKVTTLDADGRPARAEVSLGVVDESLYALYPESVQDIRAVFYGPRWSRVNTSNSLYFYANRWALNNTEVKTKSASGGGVIEGNIRMMSEKAAPRAMADSLQYAPPVIRSDFPDTAYWRANVVTGDDGTAHVTFTMPDSLTTWRLTSRGVTLNTRVGQTTASTITKKNIIVRLETPRFFIQNDRQNITAVVHNYLETDKRVKTILNTKRLKLEGSNEKTITVPAGGDARVEWPAFVEAPQNAWITVKAMTNEESDAMQLTVPVLPHGSPGRDAAAGEVDKTETFTLLLPEDYIPGTDELSLTFSASLTAGMFDVLEYLAGYPYGCVEQTMSRFLPDVVIAEAYQRAGRPLEGRLEELPKMVDKGMQRLSDFQKPDGGWGWWRGDAVNPYMTAYVVMGLAQARRADFSAPAGMLERGIEALKKTLDTKYKKDEKPTPDQYAYILYALSEAGDSSQKHSVKLFDNRNKLSNYGKAALALAMHRNGQSKHARTLMEELAAAADSTGTSVRWTGAKNRYGWTDNEVETTSLVLIAMIEITPDSDLIPRAVRFLNMSRRGNRWYSTKDTAMAVMALTRYMTKFEDPHPDYSFTVSLNGDNILSSTMTGDDIAGTGLRKSFKDRLKPGGNIININKTGTGNLYYYVSTNYFEGSDFLEAQEAGIRVERFYSEDYEGEKKLESPIRLKPGDRIWSQVRIHSESAFDYVMVEDFLPSGFEVVKDEMPYGIHPLMRRWWHGYMNKEVRDEKVVSFFTRTYRNEMAIAMPLRAEVPGEVSAMPCRASLMYFPEVGGRSSETRFIVEDK